MKWLWTALHRRGDRKWARRVAAAQTTEDLWRLFERRVPAIVGEYFRGAADHEITARGNVQAFQQEQTTAYGAMKFGAVDLSTTVAGHTLAVPWFISPVGSLRTLYPKAEAVAANVAGEFRTVMTLSTLTGTPMEEVRAASRGDCWFQLYLCGGREVALRGIARAKRAGYSGLVLTIDTGVSGNRVGHARMNPTAALGPFRGLSFGDRLKLAQAKLKLGPQMLRHLSWLWSHWSDGGMMEFVNVQMDEDGTPMPYADIGKQLGASAVTWDDLQWIKDAWGDGPLIVKGVHNAEDAKRAADSGALGIIWSNHGGRQLDRVPPVLHMVAEELPKVRDLKIDHMMDGGVRSGLDAFFAATYGIKAVGIGRVTAAGLGAGGRAGLHRAFTIMGAELERTLRLVGVSSMTEVRERGPELRRSSKLLGTSCLPTFVF